MAEVMGVDIGEREAAPRLIPLVRRLIDRKPVNDRVEFGN